MEGYYNSALEVISAIDSDMKTNRSSVKTGVLVALLLMAVPGAASARQAYVDSLWNAASQAYTDGLWQEAAASYEQISSIGLESAALYCNMGNAYYKDGNIARSILNYERALKVDPSYADARFNLEFMNEQIRDQIDPVPDFILAVWMEKICRVMDSDAWAVVFLVLLALTLAMILLFLLSPSVAGRKTGFSLGLVCLFFAVASITFSIWQKTGYEKADGAVVMSSVVSVKSSPSSEGSPNLFVLHEGTKVNGLEEVGTWYKIELADGRQGWLPAKDIEII